MKKLFIITTALIAVSISSGFSQNTAKRIDITAETGGFIGVGNQFKSSGFTPINIVASHRFNDHYSLGVGAGLNIYSDYDQTTLPVFFRFRANILKSTVTPFMQMDAGTNINLSSDKPRSNTVEGLFITPAVGVSYRLKNHKALSLSVGYGAQAGDFVKWDTSGNMSSSLTIMLGFTF